MFDWHMWLWGDKQLLTIWLLVLILLLLLLMLIILFFLFLFFSLFLPWLFDPHQFRNRWDPGNTNCAGWVTRTTVVLANTI